MKTTSHLRFLIIFSFMAIVFSTKAYSQYIYPQDADRYYRSIPGEQAVGRWDITIDLPNGTAPSWLEIRKYASWFVGRFLGRGGSVRPVSEVKYDSKTKKYSFTIPPNKLHLEFRLKGGQLKGWMRHGNGKKQHFTADRAPELKRTKPAHWGSPIDLLQDGLSDWNVPSKKWSFKNGILRNDGGGGNIKTKQKFNDFHLHVEFRYPKGSNSGIWLMGRYEVQVLDSYGMHPGSHMLGGIYGFIEPTVNAAKKPGQWQTFDITLRGRMVTVVLNGKKIICNRPIPGITGGAVDSHEGQPGPIMLQGTETGSVEYRNIIITPAE
jgi:hypothetical protein